MKPTWDDLRALCAGLALAALAIAGCATDGGVGGTGISATVQGNVLEQELGAGVVVRVRNTEIQDETDARGDFKLIGLFSGDVTLEFLRGNGSTPATVDVFVPIGAELFLANVRFRDGTVEPEEIFVEKLIGTVIADAACEDGFGAFEFQQHEGGLLFTVEIDHNTEIRKAQNLLACSDLTGGIEIKIRGRQQALQITATNIQVQKLPPPR